MRSLVSAALDVPAVTMLSNWNFSDKGSWLRETGAAGRLNIESLGKMRGRSRLPPSRAI